MMKRPGRSIRLALTLAALLAAPGAVAAPPPRPAAGVGSKSAAPPAASEPASSSPAPPAPAPERNRHRDATPATAPGAAPITSDQTAEAVRITLIVTLLTLIPALAICMTPFVRIIVVLSMIRHAFGMPGTPPNQVLVILSLFLTAFVMMPTLTQVNAMAVQPFLSGSMSVRDALKDGSGPMREFMLRQVHDSDLKTVYDISKQPLPDTAADVGLMQLTSAFMLNELRVSFKIGFVIMLPFLLIDLVVTSILLSLGMIMVPPTTLSLPLKVLMFVLIDGWSLVLQGVVGSFR
jgi:flagellar biosynthetic protein FliP